MAASQAKETVFDASSAAANKTLTGELATAEKIAAYHLDIPSLGFTGKVLTVLELIGMMFIMYRSTSFMIKHITHVSHLIMHSGH